MKNSRSSHNVWLGSSLLVCLLTSGCFRPNGDADMFGSYHADADWGTSTLILRTDHTFKQTVSTKSGLVKEGEGRWSLSGDAITLTGKYLSVTHDDPGEETNGDFASVEKNIFGSVEISADPDYGIAFRK